MKDGYKSKKYQDGSVELTYTIKLNPEQVKERKRQLELALQSYEQQIEELIRLKEIAQIELEHLS